jgi:hypothetical protein
MIKYAEPRSVGRYRRELTLVALRQARWATNVTGCGRYAGRSDLWVCDRCVLGSSGTG